MRSPPDAGRGFRAPCAPCPPRSATNRNTSSESGPRVTRSPANQSRSRPPSKSNLVQQRPQLGVASLHVPDYVGGHAPFPIPAAGRGPVRVSPAAIARRRYPGARDRGRQSSVHDVRHRQAENGDRCVEPVTVFRDHLVAAVHAADRSLDDRRARVSKSLARGQVRLLAHTTVAAYFLHVGMASVIIQWRVWSCAATVPVFRIVTVYGQIHSDRRLERE